jgi:hypothetical protein
MELAQIKARLQSKPKISASLLFSPFMFGKHLFLSALLCSDVHSKVKPNATNIGFIFRQYMEKIATPTRPFYYHTDESKLGELFKAVGVAGIKPKPIIFPFV